MKGRILIIDDNPMDLKVVSKILEKEGFACFAFSNQTEAFNWLNDNSPNLILLDLHLGDVSGYDLLPDLKKHKNTQQAPIFIISGKNELKAVTQAITLGASDYVIKPFDALVLSEKVRKVSAQNKNDFFEVQLENEKISQTYISFSSQIVSVSEFGLTLRTDLKLEAGLTYQLSQLTADFFGLQEVMARCLDVTLNNEQKNKYSAQFTFIGLNENQRQHIRKTCRALWAEQKKRVS